MIVVNFEKVQIGKFEFKLAGQTFPFRRKVDLIGGKGR